MDKCKFCQAPLDDEGKICSECGKAQDEPTEDMAETEETVEDIKDTEETAEESEKAEEPVEDEEKEEDSEEIIVEDESQAEEATQVAEKAETEDKAKKSPIKWIVLAIVLVALIVVGIFAFNKKGTPTGDKGESPMIYVTENEELKIKTSKMAEASVLGNQGFTTETVYAPFLRSEDNRKFAYLTELKALYCMPVEEATKEVIDAKYLIEENVAEILAFDHDNNNILYYVDQEGVLKAHDGKKITVISENFFANEERASLAIFFSMEDNIMLYYEGTIDERNLIIQKFGEKEPRATVENVYQVGFSESNDDGFFFYTLLNDDMENPEFAFNYFNLKTNEPIFNLTTLTEDGPLVDILWMENDGRLLTLEYLESEDDVEEEEVVKVRTEEDVLAEQSAESPITEIDDSMFEDMFAPSPAVGVYYYENGERHIIAEDIEDSTPSKYGDFVVYTRLSDIGKDFYFVNLDDLSAEHQLLMESDNPSEYTFTMEAEDGRGFIYVKQNEDGETSTLFEAILDDDGNLKESIVVEEEIAYISNAVANGHYLYMKNSRVSEELESLYLCDLYSYKDGKSELIGENVEVMSVGSSTGVEKDDDAQFFLSNVTVENGFPVGDLTMFDGKEPKLVLEGLVIPSTRSALPIVYADKNLIYYFDYSKGADFSPDLFSLVLGEEPVFVDSGIYWMV